MVEPKKVFVGTRARKGKNRILIHRKTDQFKDLVRLVREAHARVTAAKQECTDALVSAS